MLVVPSMIIRAKLRIVRCMPGVTHDLVVPRSRGLGELIPPA
ncbi:hypothetical protein [Georgenia sp. TF02-10]|nr:hypothetical protein [Georgenia sp. TF02-10]|tara:strand:- start:2105 stop:2230 length:126 start_codon:yes stop_codon:yes gene_type:complete